MTKANTINWYLLWLRCHSTSNLCVMVFTGSEGYLAIEVIMAKYGLVEAMTKWFILLCVILLMMWKVSHQLLCVSVQGLFEVSHHERTWQIQLGVGFDSYFFLYLYFYLFWWLGTIHFGMLSYCWKHEGTEWICPCQIPWAWAAGQDTTDVSGDVMLLKWLEWLSISMEERENLTINLAITLCLTRPFCNVYHDIYYGRYKSSGLGVGVLNYFILLVL